MALGPRFRGDERLIVRRTLSPFVPAHSRPKDGVASRAYGGDPVLHESMQ